MQELYALRINLCAKRGCTGDIATRMIKACDQSKGDRVGTHFEYDWNCRCRRFRRQPSGHPSRYGNHVDLPTDKIGNQCRHAFVVALRPAIFDRNIAAFLIACLAEALVESAQTAGVKLRHFQAEITANLHLWLLRPRSERPGSRRTAEE